MAFYPMICGKCSHEELIQCRMSDTLPVKCPACKKRAFGQDYAAKRVIPQDGVVKELGQQAERNRKRDGEELHALKADKMGARKKEKAPWWRSDGRKPLDLTKVRNVPHYIKTGEKNG